MAHIAEFSVTGLVGRPKIFKQTLDRTTNVFFGANGTGKTSLLRIFHSAMSMDASILENVGFKSAEVAIYSISSDQIYRLTIEKKKSGTVVFGGDDIEMTILNNDEKSKWAVSPTPEYKRWQHKYLPTTRLYASENMRLSSAQMGARSSLTTEEQLDQNFARLVQSTWNTRYGETMRAVGMTQQAGLSRVLGEVLSHQPDDENDSSKYDLQSERAFESMLNFLNRQGSHRDNKKILGTVTAFNKRYKSDPLLRNVVKRIDEVETEIERVTQPIRDLSALVEKLFSKGKTVSFEGPNISVTTPDGVLPLQQLSSGEKHLIRILLDAIDVGASTLIIDEPELSMHIDWQKDLVRNMLVLNPRCQLILATHSPEIMVDINDENIFKIK
jgi:predicted ATPase